MRGPGPNWREKHGRVIYSISGAETQLPFAVQRRGRRAQLRVCEQQLTVAARHDSPAELAGQSYISRCTLPPSHVSELPHLIFFVLTDQNEVTSGKVGLAGPQYARTINSRPRRGALNGGPMWIPKPISSLSMKIGDFAAVGSGRFHEAISKLYPHRLPICSEPPLQSGRITCGQQDALICVLPGGLNTGKFGKYRAVRCSELHLTRRQIPRSRAAGCCVRRMARTIPLTSRTLR